MPIPLTPPDDEAWYWYTRLHCHLQGLLLLFYLCNGPPALVVIFDYVNIMTMSTIYLKLCLLWLCLFYIYISIFSLSFHQFLSILFLNNQLKLFIFKHRGKTFIFLFAPCVPSINPQFTLSVITSSFLTRFCCHLLLWVALVFLIIPLCSYSFSSTSSHQIVQSTGAFHVFTTLYWHTWSSGQQTWFFLAADCSNT